MTWGPFVLFICAHLSAGFIGLWIALTAWNNKWGDIDGIDWKLMVALVLCGPSALVASILAAITFLNEDPDEPWS